MALSAKLSYLKEHSGIDEMQALPSNKHKKCCGLMQGACTGVLHEIGPPVWSWESGCAATQKLHHKGCLN